MAEEKAVGCFMCTNAHTNPELTSNDVAGGLRTPRNVLSSWQLRV